MKPLRLAVVFLVSGLTGTLFGAETDVACEKTAPTAAKAASSSSSALVVPLGGTVRLQMKTKKAIKTVVNPKDNVINIRTVAGDPTTILITGQQPDVTTVELIDVDDRKETYEVSVQLDVEYLRTQLRRAVPTSNINPIPSTNNAVILTGTVAQAEDVAIILQVVQSIEGIKVINALRVIGLKQVQLDVVVASLHHVISSTDSLRMIPLAAPAGQSARADTSLIGILNFLRQVGLAKLVCSPSLVTRNGRPATFLVGGELAVPVVGADGATGVQFEPFGTQLTFLPIVLGDGRIYLEVNPSTNLDDAFGPTICAAGPIPGRHRIRVNTGVRVESGQSLVIRGLTRHPASTEACRLPLPEASPFLNALFGVKSNDVEEVVIMVTPHVLDQ